MQKYILKVPLTPNDDVAVHPPSSWIQAAVYANLVHQQHSNPISFPNRLQHTIQFYQWQLSTMPFTEIDIST